VDVTCFAVGQQLPRG